MIKFIVVLQATISAKKKVKTSEVRKGMEGKLW